MADCSLDDYIRQKGIGLNIKKRAVVGTQAIPKINAPKGNAVFAKKLISFPTTAKGQQKFDARRFLSKPGVKAVGTMPKKSVLANRLGGTTKSVGIPRLSNVTVPNVSMQKITGPVSDARQRILAKTKFADARQRILTKKIQNEASVVQTASVFDIRQKLEAKRGILTQHFPSSVQQVSGIVRGPEETQPVFDWGAPSAPQSGVMNFGGNILRTVANPSATAFNPGPVMANPLATNTPSVPMLQNTTQIRRTLKNDLVMANASAQPQNFLKTVPPAQQSARALNFNVVDQQPIQTVISQPPVKVTNKGAASVSTLVKSQTHVAKQPEAELTSPLQGFSIRVSNLHPNVSHEDIIELFGAVGALKHARLLKSGIAEVVFVNHEDAVAAITKYHMRELDGQPMSLVLKDQKPVQTLAPSARTTSDIQHQPLRLNRAVPSQVVELEPGILHKALFKTSSVQAVTKPVSFTVHM